MLSPHYTLRPPWPLGCIDQEFRYAAFRGGKTFGAIGVLRSDKLRLEVANMSQTLKTNIRSTSCGRGPLGYKMSSLPRLIANLLHPHPTIRNYQGPALQPGRHGPGDDDHHFDGFLSLGQGRLHFLLFRDPTPTPPLITYLPFVVARSIDNLSYETARSTPRATSWVD